MIVQEDLFLSTFDINIDDDNSGTSNGNNNGLINPGEEIELGISLKNYGTLTANSVTSTISTSSNITISDSYESYGNILSGTSEFSTDDFDLTIPYNVLGGTEIDLDVEITSSNRDQWQDIISLYIV